MFEQIWKRIIHRKPFSIWMIPAFLLWLFSWLYRAGQKIHSAFTSVTVKVDVPVISVGNISVGGTGKTPVVAFIAEALLKEGLKVGIVSSGYGRKSDKDYVERGYKLLKMKTENIGDEVIFLANRLPEAIFSISNLKSEAAKNLVSQHKVDLLIVDDAFQHKKLYRNFDIVTFDAAVKKKLLKFFPYGVLRESLSALSRADQIIITRSDFSRDISKLKEEILSYNPFVDLYHARFTATELVGKERNLSVKYLEDKSLLIFAGIGNFKAFKKQVSALSTDIDFAWEFSDHQDYDLETLKKIKAKADLFDSDVIVTTGKDWVKLGDFDFGREIYYINQVIDLDPGEEKLIKNLLSKLNLKKAVI